MMRNVSVEWHESGLIISQKDVTECIVIPNFLKYNFYEEILNACLDGSHMNWSDLNNNTLLMNYEHKNNFNCFINSVYVGELPFIKVSETSVAIPINTMNNEQVYEVYDSIKVECCLLFESELF